MKTLKIILSTLIVVTITVFTLVLNEGMAEPQVFKDYEGGKDLPLEIPLNAVVPVGWQTISPGLSIAIR